MTIRQPHADYMLIHAGVAAHGSCTRSLSNPTLSHTNAHSLVCERDTLITHTLITHPETNSSLQAPRSSLQETNSSLQAPRSSARAFTVAQAALKVCPAPTRREQRKPGCQVHPAGTGKQTQDAGRRQSEQDGGPEKVLCTE